MIDESTELGARVARHLREEIVVWMTTVGMNPESFSRLYSEPVRIRIERVRGH